MTTAIERIKKIAAEKQAATLKAYQKLVLGLVNGGKLPAEETIIDILTQLGKTADDLETDVRRGQRRKQLRETIAESERALAEELPEIERQITEAQQEFRKAEEEFGAKIRPLRMEKERIVALQASASHAERELRESMDDATADELSDLALQLNQATENRKAAEREAKRVEAERPVKKSWSAEPTADEMRHWQDTLETKRQRLADAQATEAAIVERQNELVEQSQTS